MKTKILFLLLILFSMNNCVKKENTEENFIENNKKLEKSNSKWKKMSLRVYYTKNTSFEIKEEIRKYFKKKYDKKNQTTIIVTIKPVTSLIDIYILRTKVNGNDLKDELDDDPHVDQTEEEPINTLIDSDEDGVTDVDETERGTKPHVSCDYYVEDITLPNTAGIDCDGDGVNDVDEIDYGSDPHDENDYPN